MEIMEYIDIFLGSLLTVIFSIIIVKNVFNVKTIENKFAKSGYLILATIVLSTINIFNKNTFKGVMTLPIAVLYIQKIFNVKFSTSIFYTLVFSFYLLIGEVLSTFILSIFNIEYNFFMTNLLGKTMGNIIVIISTIPLLYINFISNIFISIYKKKFSNKTITIIFIVFLTIGSAFIFNGISNIKNIISITMNFIIFAIFIFLLYISYIERQKINKISNEYNSLLTYLDKYENELVEKRKLIHDFRNQLIVINGYIGEDDKLREYLNEIIEEQKNIKETKIVKNIDKLPKGLKGLIYYKLSQIDSKVNIDLNVKSKFKDFNKFDAKDNKNILKIVGILLDNAIESSINSYDKHIFIEISMYRESFKINISNSYFGKIEKSKIMDAGFSTKGKNRGYGLSLVKDIIKKNDKYNLFLNISDLMFKIEFHASTK